MHAVVRECLRVAPLLTLALACGPGAPPTPEAPPAAPSAIDRLRAAFWSGTPPQEANLRGRWVVTRIVSQSERESELSDPEGIRRPDIDGEPLEWVLDFVPGPDGELWAVSNTAWIPSGDSSAVATTPAGDFVFSKDFGGDDLLEYHCRAVGPARLVCLLGGIEGGHGVEFVKRPGAVAPDS